MSLLLLKDKLQGQGPSDNILRRERAWPVQPLLVTQELEELFTGAPGADKLTSVKPDVNRTAPLSGIFLSRCR